MLTTWGFGPGNSTACVGGFQPNEGGLPAGRAIAPVREIPVRRGKGASSAPIDPRDSQGRKASSRESGQIRHVASTLIRLKRDGCPGICNQERLANLGSHLKVA